ncbi:MAG: SDR family NAD(P)-dependent oxidoreductase [Planctomycetes bacterium]|nr:SDR family NAD(P)-dependent oxidoreductase [Planctomycetota bacterium]
MEKLGSKVLVTGAAGFIGSHLAERLCSQGLEVVGIDNLSNGCEENVSGIGEGFELVKGDILKPEELSKACEGVDSVFHLAAQSSVAKSTEDPVSDFELNVKGTLNVLECARKAGVKTLVFTSSCTVYGDAATPTAEDHPLGPISNYGASKAAAEAYFSSYSTLYGMGAVSVRYFNIYGPRTQKGVMFDLLQKLREDNGKLEVLGTGDQVKDYLYIDDAIDGTLLAVSEGEGSGEAYNVGSGEACTVKELVEGLLKAVGLDGKTEVTYKGGLSWPGDVQKSHSDISKMKGLGFAPKFTFDKGLKAFVDWYRAEFGKVVEG